MARLARLLLAALAAACAAPTLTSCGDTVTTVTPGRASVTIRNLSALVWTARFTADSGASAALLIPSAKLCWRDVAVPNTLELFSPSPLDPAVFRAPFIVDTGGVDVRINADSSVDVQPGPREC